MLRHFETSLTLAMLGLLASACDAPASDETNDELGAEASESDESDGSTGTESSTSSSDTADTADTTDTTTSDGMECECIAEQPDYEPPMMPLCGETLCPTVSQVDGQEGVPELATPEALVCALTALRERTPGIVTWSSTFNGGQFSDTGYVLIQANGEAVRREWGAEDLSYDVDPALRFELHDAAYYDACLADLDDSARYYCLREYPNPSLAICEAGWSESDG